MSGEQEYDLSMVKYKTLHDFIKYNLEKYRNEGQCVKHKGCNGRPPTSHSSDVEQEEKIIEDSCSQGQSGLQEHSGEYHEEAGGQGLPQEESTEDDPPAHGEESQVCKVGFTAIWDWSGSQVCLEETAQF